MISKLTQEIIDNCIIEFKKKQNKKKILNNIIDPTIIYILNKLYPYIFTLVIILFLIIIILFINLFYLIKYARINI